ncbi:hypothetical protein ACRAKI_00820 [Saccharothrix isguenensis]
MTLHSRRRTEPCGHKFGGHCPQRLAARKETAGTKSKAGKRGMGLPDELIGLLRQHSNEQQQERVKAAQLWKETGAAGVPIPA